MRLWRRDAPRTWHACRIPAAPVRDHRCRLLASRLTSRALGTAATNNMKMESVNISGMENDGRKRQSIQHDNCHYGICSLPFVLPVPHAAPCPSWRCLLTGAPLSSDIPLACCLCLPCAMLCVAYIPLVAYACQLPHEFPIHLPALHCALLIMGGRRTDYKQAWPWR